MRKPRSTFLGCLIGMLFAAPPAEAQFDLLTGLANSFSDLAIQWGRFTPRVGQIRPESDPKSRWLGSYGAEFIFEIAEVNTSKKKAPKSPCNKVGRGDPKERHVTHKGGLSDSVDIYVLESKCEEPDPNFQLEFGVGFFQTSRFQIADAIGTMTGAFRETPSISVYATWLHGEDGSLRPYGALRAGVTELVAPSLDDPSGRSFSGAAPKSVETGLVLGLARRIIPQIPANLFLEAAYMYRPFTGITWAANKDNEDSPVPPPSGARKRLNFSGTSVMIGLQITVKEPDKK